MNRDRGIVKWAPFSSLVGQKEMIDALVLEKQKIKKPILSLEQQMEIEEKLMEAFYEQIEVTLQIYKKGVIFYLNDYKKWLLFEWVNFHNNVLEEENV